MGFLLKNNANSTLEFFNKEKNYEKEKKRAISQRN